ncbi:hypothetical protein HDU98_002105 [Podochytrium sp. JEL0797]|nr:hypothetical protein HDU98_002105 [Podochytrium sp. JEL0797]
MHEEKHESHADKKPLKMEEAVHVEVEDDISPELEALLHTEPLEGLTDAEVAARTLQFGLNEIPESKSNPLLKFLSYFLGPISYLLEIACILSGVFHEWIDFGILLFVLIANACIGFFEEARAESALDALKNTLAQKSRVWRNGKLVEVDSNTLVPGDIVALRLGDIIPADCRLLGVGVTGEMSEGTLQIDQSALTGESLPVAKGKGVTAYSSAIVKQGQMLAVVTKTGINTYIGRAANLISITTEEGHFQKIINAIGNFLVVVTCVMAIVLFFVRTWAVPAKPNDPLGERKESLMEVLVLTIAAIPVGLPTIMSHGRRSPSTSHDFEGTGVQYTDQDLLLASFFASEPGAQDPIESAVRAASQERVELLKNRENQDHHIPGYKVSTPTPIPLPTVTDLTTGKQFRCIKGAPQVIVNMVGGHDEATAAVNDLARRGLRALGVARTIDAEMQVFEMIGMISLVDPPRPDSAHTIQECHKLGLDVKMITGDQQIIGKEVAHRLGMNRTILDANKLNDPTLDEEALIDRCVKCDGFAQVTPEHKFRVVELLQKRGYLVGMTGDGKANVGIAVEGCTDAARSAADIVLLAAGLSTIVDGIKCSRAIFQRMRSYALYRIASTIHFLLFFFLSICTYGFSLPPRLILMIAVLNDVATLVISVDNAQISQRPDKWRLGQLITMSFVLGFLLMLISWAHFFVGHYAFGLTTVDYKDDPTVPNAGVLQTIMYLQISSCPHFVIFSTRLPGYFYENAPSWTFIIAVAGTQVIAMFMAMFGVRELDATAIGWKWACAVIAISTLMFMLLDIVKVWMFRIWSFELTVKLYPTASRKEELETRVAKRIVKARVYANIEKLRKVYYMSMAVVAFEKAVAARKKTARAGASTTTLDM